MAMASPNLISIPTKRPSFLFSRTTTLLPRFALPNAYNLPKRHRLHVSNALPDSKQPPERFISGHAPNQPRKGSDVLVEALEREGVTHVFAYPSGGSMEMYQALTRSRIIRSVLPKHEQGSIFTAQGYAQASGLPGICVATTSGGTGAMYIATDLSYANNVPIVILITSQDPEIEPEDPDAFPIDEPDAVEETSMVEVTRYTTKRNYLVLDVQDIPRIVREAFHVASSGRPGPVLIDIPKHIQQQLVVPKWDEPMRLSGLPKPPNDAHLEQIIRLISESKKPVLYCGDGCLNSSVELHRFVELTKIPLATTLRGLGAYPASDDLCLGMHGTTYANYAFDKTDLLLVFGVGFDYRVTQELEGRAKIIHVDIDAEEIRNNKTPHVSIYGDIKIIIQGLNKILESTKEANNLDFSNWRKELDEQKKNNPLSFKTFGDAISPQYAIQVLDELTGGKAIISTGVWHHQMWAAQFYKYNRPRQWLTPAAFWAKGFGMPAAIGAAVARPDAIVVDIEGDRTFVMSIQQLRTIRAENLPVKILILNNHLYEANCAHTYLGDPLNELKIFPNMLAYAKESNIPAARVTKKADLRAAIQKMLDTSGPYVLDVAVPPPEDIDSSWGRLRRWLKT